MRQALVLASIGVPVGIGLGGCRRKDRVGIPGGRQRSRPDIVRTYP